MEAREWLLRRDEMVEAPRRQTCTSRTNSGGSQSNPSRATSACASQIVAPIGAPVPSSDDENAKKRNRLARVFDDGDSGVVARDVDRGGELGGEKRARQRRVGAEESIPSVAFGVTQLTRAQDPRLHRHSPLVGLPFGVKGQSG